MAAVRAGGFELVDHPRHYPDFSTIGQFSVPQHEKHLAGKQYRTDDEVMSAVEITMRASIPREYMRCNTDARSVWGDYVEKLNQNFGRIRPLHHSQDMNFSTHPRTCKKKIIDRVCHLMQVVPISGL